VARAPSEPDEDEAHEARALGRSDSRERSRCVCWQVARAVAARAHRNRAPSARPPRDERAPRPRRARPQARAEPARATGCARVTPEIQAKCAPFDPPWGASHWVEWGQKNLAKAETFLTTSRKTMKTVDLSVLPECTHLRNLSSAHGAERTSHRSALTWVESHATLRYSPGGWHLGAAQPEEPGLPQHHGHGP